MRHVFLLADWQGRVFAKGVLIGRGHMWSRYVVAPAAWPV
jgi:hypothetical protein